jgi:hypothetical protein
MNKYSAETREHWGDTSAYREHQEKTKHYTKEKWAKAVSRQDLAVDQNRQRHAGIPNLADRGRAWHL